MTGFSSRTVGRWPTITTKEITAGRGCQLDPSAAGKVSHSWRPRPANLLYGMSPGSVSSGMSGGGSS